MRAIIGALLTPDDEDENAQLPALPAGDPVAEAEAEGAAQAEQDSLRRGRSGGRRGGVEGARATRRRGLGRFALLKILFLFCSAASACS